MRLCDRHGCTNPGNCPAPKSPNSPERWYFCEAHAAEYNRGWDYFEGLSAEDAAERAADEARGANSYARAQHYAWGGSGDGSRSEEHTSELQSLMRISYAVFCLNTKTTRLHTRYESIS